MRGAHPELPVEKADRQKGDGRKGGQNARREDTNGNNIHFCSSQKKHEPNQILLVLLYVGPYTGETSNPLTIDIILTHPKSVYCNFL